MGLLFARYEWILLELLVLGLAIWELISIRRAVARDRAAKARGAQDAQVPRKTPC